LFVGRRDHGHRQRASIARQRFVADIGATLEEIQGCLFNRARDFMKAHTVRIDTKKEFYDFFTPADSQNPEIHGGFSESFWCGSGNCETRIKEDLSVTIRCIPFAGDNGRGRCICCGEPAQGRVVFAKAY
jgi:prolyl-tRNA synthetase